MGWMEQGEIDHTRDGPLYALPSALQILRVGPLTTTLMFSYDYLHFAEKEAETQKSQLTSPNVKIE